MHKMKRILAVCMLALFMGVFFGAPARQAALPVVQAEAAQAAGNSNNATGFLDGITYNKGSNGSAGKLNVKVGDGQDTDFNGLMSRYKNIIMAFTGILTITCFGAMILQITKLAASGDNEQARRKAIMGILTTGIGVALLGSATIVIGFFYGAISNNT